MYKVAPPPPHEVGIGSSYWRRNSSREEGNGKGRGRGMEERRKEGEGKREEGKEKG